MNTEVVLAAVETTDAEAVLQATRLLIEDCERRFSRFLPGSEVSALNRSAGAWFSTSPELIEMLQQSRQYHQSTGGLFDPSILPDLKRAGYDRSIDEIRGTGAARGPEPREDRPDFQSLEIDTTGGRVRLLPGMQIDLGGIAKGWIVNKAAGLLSEDLPNCAVSAGGDIVFKGTPADGELWQIRIEDPWDSAREVMRLGIGAGAVATSSVVKRSWRQHGVSRHHLIDPRTGEPAAGDWVSVTVLAPSIMTAEVYAKAVLIGGAGETPRLLQQEPEISFFAVKMDGSILSSFELMESFDEHKSRVLQ